MAINALIEQICEDEGVGFIDLWGYVVRKQDMYVRDDLYLSVEVAAMFSENTNKLYCKVTHCLVR